jgi:hypothetical protein
MADLLSRLGRPDEARAMWQRAADLTRNARERELLLARAHHPPPEGGPMSVLSRIRVYRRKSLPLRGAPASQGHECAHD